jgi:hypothetical protein
MPTAPSKTLVYISFENGFVDQEPLTEAGISVLAVSDASPRSKYSLCAERAHGVSS